jgi:hypothetical protein
MSFGSVLPFSPPRLALLPAVLVGAALLLGACERRPAAESTPPAPPAGHAATVPAGPSATTNSAPNNSATASSSTSTPAPGSVSSASFAAAPRARLVTPLDDTGHPDGPPVLAASPARALPVPPALAAFDSWLARHAAASPAERPALLAEGRALLAARRPVMAALLASDPEAALLLTPSPVARATLPAELRGELEQIVAATGFYGVKAICNHAPGAAHAEACRIVPEAIIDGVIYPASIYGERQARLTEMDASLYGVVLDGRIALHPDDFVVLPAADVSPDPALAGQLAVIHHGRTTFTPGAASLPAHLQSLLASP